MPSNDFVLGLFAKEGAAQIICGGISVQKKYTCSRSTILKRLQKKVIA